MFQELVGFYLTAIVEAQNDSILPSLMRLDVPRYILVREHTRLKLSLEGLEDWNKQDMWEFVHKNFPDKSKEFRIDCCKIIQLVDYLFENKKP